MEKLCCICNQPFHSNNPKAKVCNRIHLRTCAVCGKEFQVTKEQALGGTQTCSKECRYKLTFSTYRSNYDKELNPEGYAKLQAKQRAIMLEKYGAPNALCSSLSFRRDGMIAKYGVNHPTKLPDFEEKRSATCIKKYGVPYVLQNEEVKKKSIDTCLEKYGKSNYAKSVNFYADVISDKTKSDACFRFHGDPEKFILGEFQDKPTLQQLAEKCGIRDSSVGQIILNHSCQDLVRYVYSTMEEEVYDFLVEMLGKEAIIERNTYKYISPYELDIYLPQYRLAIECNPTITHNSSIPGFGESDEPKPVRYHQMKTNLCEEKGIFLFHIYGYEWSNKRDIIKSMIRNLLTCNSSKIYARKCKIKEVNSTESLQFLNNNHRQGGAISKIRLGLYYQDELVSLMTFSKMRNTLGTGKQDTSHAFELVRFCNKLNTTVIGGASKLFNYFIESYHPEEIRSFSDRSHTRGNLYTRLGFKFDHVTDPSYVWVALKTDIAYSRVNAQKQNIKKFLGDDELDLSKTETELMVSHKYVQVFDSGVILWIWRKEKLDGKA